MSSGTRGLLGDAHRRACQRGKDWKTQKATTFLVGVYSDKCLVHTQPDGNDHHMAFAPLPQAPPSLGVVGSQALPSLSFARDWKMSPADYSVHPSAARTSFVSSSALVWTDLHPPFEWA